VTSPNGIVCPFWDDLDPSAGGSVWTGVIGTAPNRKWIASWLNVPHTTINPSPTRFSFQAILHETRQIAFQYLQVESGKSTLVSGKSATIGVEDATGLVAAKYAFNPGTAVVTNNQALLFSAPSDVAPPGLTCTPASQPGQFLLQLYGEPGRVSVLSASTDLQTWTALVTNITPASGRISLLDSNGGVLQHRFYRATLAP
jgi:hypothetical protein